MNDAQQSRLRAVVESHAGIAPAAVDEIIDRLDPQGEVGTIILRQLRAYCSAEDMNGRVVLDFGCGRGSSTLIMAEKYPHTQFVGVELMEEYVELAIELAAASGLENVRFLVSPDGEHLPDEIVGKSFDLVTLSAVYEHLLPSERRSVLPLLWRCLKTGGILLLNQTPHSWAPFEHHSTGLWGINYLPDRVAHWAARKFGRINRSITDSPDWNVQLRGGLRGGAETDVLKDITLGGGSAEILQPLYGSKDRADFWLNATSPRLRFAKRIISAVFRLSDRAIGVVPSTNMEVALRKVR